MKKIEKILAIITWFVLIFVLNSLLNKVLIKYTSLNEDWTSQLSFIAAIIITALILNSWVKKILMADIPKIINEDAVEDNDKALQNFITARSEWNLYALKSQDFSSPFLWLARKQIDWVQPYLSMSDDDKLFLLKKIRKVDRKLDAILDDPKSKEKFREFLLKSWQEKVLDYSILLESKKQFLEISTEERFEVLENRDVLAILKEYLVKFGYKNISKLDEDIEYEDNILREFYQNNKKNDNTKRNKQINQQNFTVAAHDIEIKMRPKKFWWWQAAEHGTDNDSPIQIKQIR